MPRLNNHVRLVGRLNDTPEIRFLTDGTPTTRVRLFLAPRPGSGAQSFQLVATGPTAERMATSLAKNDRVLVDGALHNRRFERQSQTHLRTDIRVDTFLLLAAPGKQGPVDNRTHDLANH